MKGKKEERVIKRYRNRKLYDTQDSCYVTLEDISDMVRQGIDICVIDNNSGNDLTSVTLAQIILEGEKRKKEALPLSTLFSLVRTGGEVVRDFVHKSFQGSVKEVTSARDEIHDHLEGLINKGAIGSDEGNILLDSIKKFFDDKVRPTVESVQNIPSVKAEVQSLKRKLESIEKELKKKPTRKKKI